LFDSSGNHKDHITGNAMKASMYTPAQPRGAAAKKRRQSQWAEQSQGGFD